MQAILRRTRLIIFPAETVDSRVNDGLLEGVNVLFSPSLNLKNIIPLGRFAMQTLLGTFEGF